MNITQGNNAIVTTSNLGSLILFLPVEQTMKTVSTDCKFAISRRWPRISAGLHN